MRWPTTAEELAREQERLAKLAADPWTAGGLDAPRVGACAVVFSRSGDVGWAAAFVTERGEPLGAAGLSARIDAEFHPGEQALGEGPILEAAVRALPYRPDLLLVAAAGRDHPRRAGLALHLGAVLDLPTVGVTDEPLRATGDLPARAWGSRSPLHLKDEVVAYYVRTRGGTKPVVAHAAWRTSAEVAADVVLGACSHARWPDVLREARRYAREARRAGAK